MLSNLCACGCGRPTNLATRNNARRGHIKGQPYKYLTGHRTERARLASSERMLRLNREPWFRDKCDNSELRKRRAAESARRGANHPWYKGGRLINSNGYIVVYAPDHPNAGRKGYVLEHVLVATKAIGRPLKDDEVVHHINENRADNRNQNLVICTNSYHALIHHRMGSFPQSKRKEG